MRKLISTVQALRLLGVDDKTLETATATHRNPIIAEAIKRSHSNDSTPAKFTRGDLRKTSVQLCDVFGAYVRWEHLLHVDVATLRKTVPDLTFIKERNKARHRLKNLLPIRPYRKN